MTNNNTSIISSINIITIITITIIIIISITIIIMAARITRTAFQKEARGIIARGPCVEWAGRCHSVKQQTNVAGPI